MSKYPNSKMDPKYASNAMKVVRIARARRDAMDVIEELERYGMEFQADSAREFVEDCDQQIRVYRLALLNPEVYSDIPF